jgi:hypothetical protein
MGVTVEETCHRAASHEHTAKNNRSSCFTTRGYTQARLAACSGWEYNLTARNASTTATSQHTTVTGSFLMNGMACRGGQRERVLESRLGRASLCVHWSSQHDSGKQAYQTVQGVGRRNK